MSSMSEPEELGEFRWDDAVLDDRDSICSSECRRISRFKVSVSVISLEISSSLSLMAVISKLNPWFLASSKAPWACFKAACKLFYL